MRACVRACVGEESDYSGGEFSEFAVQSATGEGEGGVGDGAAPVTLDGVGGTAGAGEDEGEGGAEVVELVEKDGVADEVVAERDSFEFEAGKGPGRCGATA